MAKSNILLHDSTRHDSQEELCSVFSLCLFLFLSFGFGGCAAVGPKAIEAGRFNYNEAVIGTWNEQLLLNLVRLKYRDTPYFLEISSVSTQYNLGAVAGAGTQIDTDGRAESYLTANLGASYEERPTITYSPLQGEKFAKQIMSSVPLETLLLLANSGWSIDRIMRSCIQQMNDTPNAPSAAGPTPEREPRYLEFQHLSRTLRKMQLEALIKVGPKTIEGKRVVVLRIRPDASSHPLVQELRKILKLDKGRTEYRLTTNPLQRRPGEINLLTRSLIGVMFYLSQAVEVPEDDIQLGRVTRTLSKSTEEPFDWSKLTENLIRIHSSDKRPENSFVKVRYRGSWFFIEDTDLTSKSTFMLLAQLFSLQAGDIKMIEPTLTLPIGG